ncbi:MAG: decarboxylating NADP(+)-dependent phosphogluconate dehydrogenase [Ignavibacteriaceae bacterium]|nr:decarboxylating NADP(+)-dependent phosphogluconate dehydrogenase [Ignavibacteriaceae bacterium]
MNLSDIAIIGIGVMGENLALNIESKNYSAVVYDKDTAKVEKFIKGRAAGKRIQSAESLSDLAAKLVSPRKILMMVPAGKAVDALIDELIPILAPNDILIDGGNSHYPDTNRRTKYLEDKGLLYIGTGVSGGEEGALKGPSIMPGGSYKAWEYVKPIFQDISAKVEDGDPCCDWVGENGAGHFVKMVHNGIEYGDMQLICEAYQIMKDLLGLSYNEMYEIFKRWNEGELQSYLIEITRDILSFNEEDGSPLVEKILDKAGQKGTGKWTVLAALDLGAPLTLISEAVFARTLSSLKDERVEASKLLNGPIPKFNGNKEEFIENLGKALYASKIISYTQGYVLLRNAAEEYGWNLNYGGIALMWRGGCIIRSVFLGKIKEAFDNNSQLTNLLVDPFFKEKIEASQEGWRKVVAESILNGVWTPALTTALNYYDGFRNGRLPANLLQAQRDYFGAHQYERVDKPRGEYFHTNWTGRGGDTASSTYTL